MGRKNQAYEYLKNAIIKNELPPGTPLREMDISEQLHMSRSPIREALRELEAEGVVISYPARGTIVTPVTPSDVEEIYELRSLLEVWALEQGFHRFTEDDLDLIEQGFTKAYQSGDWQALHEADIYFHQTIINKSGSKRVIGFLNTLNIQIERVRRYSAQTATRMDISLQEHIHIINMIRSKDLPKTRTALRNHLRSVANSAIEAARLMDI